MTDPVIPTVDLEDLESSDPSRAQRAAAAIREGFGTYGLVYVKGHGVDMATLDRLYDEFVRYTARPESEKRKECRSDIWFQRGWTPPNTEQAVASSAQPDFKECYFAAPIASHTEMKLQYPEIHADNVWPERSDTFREPYLEVGRQLHRAGIRLLSGAAAALNIDQSQLTQCAEGGPHVFRLLRYLPLSSEQVGTKIVWGEEHTDFNLLTLLPGGRFLGPEGKRCAAPDSGSGLYLRTRSNTENPHGIKVKGVAPEGCIVAQVGQALEILTGGAFLATPHVITAPKTPGYTRLSAAHFVHVHSHQILFPLSAFRTERAIKSYSPPVLAGTYAVKTLVDIRLAPQDALAHLGYRHYDRLTRERAGEERHRQHQAGS